MPGIVPDGKGLVEALGESIEVQGVGLSWGVRVTAREGDSASVVDLCNKGFREEAVGLVEGGLQLYHLRRWLCVEQGGGERVRIWERRNILRPTEGKMRFLSHSPRLSLPLSPRLSWFSYFLSLDGSRPLAHSWGWFSSLLRLEGGRGMNG